jgi:PTS system mannose-specific IID component
MGALIASYVNVNSGISFTASGVEFNLQTQLFDAILPKLLPLGVTFLCYQMLKKGYSAVKIILILVVIGIIGNFTGILA